MKKKKNISIKIIIFIIVMILLLLLFLILAFFTVSKVVDSQKNPNTINDDIIKGIDSFSSVQEIIEYSHSKFIGESKYNQDGYSKKYEVVFAYDLYQDDESMEKFYTTIINRVAYFLKYNTSFIMVDNVKNIEIKVKCNNGRIAQVLINGETNYFLKHDNLNSLNNSKSEVFTDFSVKSPEVQSVIKKDWKYNTKDFGTVDSKFNGYDIYGDEGFEVKEIQNKVYNIIINSNYSGNVINNIDLNYELEDVIDSLGTPTFGDISSTCIGYKNDSVYVFFVNEKCEERSISIYPNIEYETEEFEALLNKFYKSEINIKTFMNELTYLWPDYYDYSYTESSLKIRYPNKGLKIELGNNTDNEIAVYDNYKLSTYTKKLIQGSKIISKLDSSLYYEIEDDRIRFKQGTEVYLDEIYEHEDVHILTKSEKYCFIYEKNNYGDVKKVLFISKNPEKYYNKELNENVYRGFFIDDNNYIYSIKNKGIYVYNIETNEKSVIEEGQDDYDLINFTDNILYFDEKSVSLEME